MSDRLRARRPPGPRWRGRKPPKIGINLDNTQLGVVEATPRGNPASVVVCQAVTTVATISSRPQENGDPEVISDAGVTTISNGRHLPGLWLVRRHFEQSR